MLILECVEPKKKKKRELECKGLEWATAHYEASIVTKKVCRNRAS